MNSSHSSHHFIVPVRYYLLTLIALLLLTVITVYTAKYLDFGGRWNIFIALVIAMFKAALVVLFFMGLKWDKGLNTVFFLGTILFVLIFLVLTLIDYASRNDIYSDSTQTYELKSPVKAPSKHKK